MSCFRWPLEFRRWPQKCRWDRQIGTDRDKNGIWRGSLQPREFFRRNREDLEIGEVENAAHSAELDKASNGID